MHTESVQGDLQGLPGDIAVQINHVHSAPLPRYSVVVYGDEIFMRPGEQE